jgi:hypothetical protein
MYEAQAEKDWKFIINDSDSKLVLVATERIYEKTQHYINKVPLFLSLNLPPTPTPGR